MHNNILYISYEYCMITTIYIFFMITTMIFHNLNYRSRNKLNFR